MSAAPAKRLRTNQSALSGALRQFGKILWYNGRKQIGKVLGDDGRELFIPVGGAFNKSMVPLTPQGLMHGTRVSYRLVDLGSDDSCDACTDVRPCVEVESQRGLECGVETRINGRPENQDRVAACDLCDIGFLAAVFDGHGATTCADYVSQTLPSVIHNVFCTQSQQLKGGLRTLSPKDEEHLITSTLRKAFDATDKEFCKSARQMKLYDGSTAVVALLAHGFEAPPGKATVPGTDGGVAKLFVAWCGDSRAVLVRGTRAVRLSQDHKPERKDETRRIEKAGGAVVNINGIYRVGSKRDQPFDQWLSTSRSFGDLTLKEPDPLVISEPDLHVRILTPEDWAVVLVCDGITDVLTNQEIADVCWDVMVLRGLGPVESAKEIADLAAEKGSLDNLSVFVMRLGWAMPDLTG